MGLQFQSLNTPWEALEKGRTSEAAIFLFSPNSSQNRILSHHIFINSTHEEAPQWEENKWEIKFSDKITF